jgi:hypothetical protein
MRENREIPWTSATHPIADRPEKALGRTSGVHVYGKSDIGRVPTKAANKAKRDEDATVMAEM